MAGRNGLADDIEPVEQVIADVATQASGIVSNVKGVEYALIHCGGHPVPSTCGWHPFLAAAGIACQAADDDVQEGDNAVHDGHDDGANAVYHGHDGAADGAEASLDLVEVDSVVSSRLAICDGHGVDLRRRQRHLWEREREQQR